MDISIIIQMVAAAMFAALLYTLIGVAPGTDETAVIAPVTLVLVLTGIEPVVILAFFISAIIAHKLTDSIPVATAGIPGGVMATPMIEHALVFKKYGIPDVSIRKMASGSVIGTLVAVPVSLLLAGALIPVADIIKGYGDLLFVLGAILLALLSKARWLALASIIPFALLIQGLRHLYWGVGAVPEGTNVFTSFFLGITIGPIILLLFELLNKEKRNKLPRFSPKIITLKKLKKSDQIPNPFTILTRKELIVSSISSVIGTFTFVLSAVGTTVFVGELVSSKTRDPLKKASLSITSMEALANATYISGTLIPLIALGIPLSSVAIGPANPLFNAPPVFDLDYNMHHALTMTDFVMATLIGSVIALLFTYFITIRYAQQICKFIFKKIPHEAILGLFFSLVLLIAYMDAGWINIGGVFLVSIVAGVLHRWGLNYGVQFMILYAAPWIVSHLAG